MNQRSTFALMESMYRDLDSIDRQIVEANKIDDGDEREQALMYLFAEMNTLQAFYQSIINDVARTERLAVSVDGILIIL